MARVTVRHHVAREQRPQQKERLLASQISSRQQADVVERRVHRSAKDADLLLAIG
jgi:hypothetical protein